MVTATVLVVSIFFNADLSAPANPGPEPQPGACTLVFRSGSRSCCCHLHPAVVVSVIPLIAAIFLLAIPYLPYAQSTEGVWFASARGRTQSLRGAVAAMVVTPALIMLDALVVKTAPWAAGMSFPWSVTVYCRWCFFRS